MLDNNNNILDEEGTIIDYKNDENDQYKSYTLHSSNGEEIYEPVRIGRGACNNKVEDRCKNFCSLCYNTAPCNQFNAQKCKYCCRYEQLYMNFMVVIGIIVQNILKIFEVWHYDNIEQHHLTSNGDGGLFIQYVNTFMKMKLVMGNTNAIIAPYTAAQAQLKLYSYIEGLKIRVLYFDTDSIIYLSLVDKQQYQVPTSWYLGERTDELQYAIHQHE
uniref:DNA-directed DNA polymerase n=1 Tax=Romanomermis culicivorax TaxID=13658 RepID=A0A915JN84_ROMCU